MTHIQIKAINICQDFLAACSKDTHTNRLSKSECNPAGWIHPAKRGGGGMAGVRLAGFKGVRGSVLLDNDPSQCRGWLKQATMNQRQAKIYWYVLWYVGNKNAT